MIGYRLRWEREKRGWQQQEVAPKLGVTPSALSRYENGRTEVPLEVVALAAELYGPHVGEEYCASCPVRQAIKKAALRKGQKVA